MVCRWGSCTLHHNHWLHAKHHCCSGMSTNQHHCRKTLQHHHASRASRGRVCQHAQMLCHHMQIAQHQGHLSMRLAWLLLVLLQIQVPHPCHEILSAPSAVQANVVQHWHHD